MPSSNISGSVNIPFQDVLENGKFKAENEIASRFAHAGVSEKQLVFSCGSGITACILLLASELALGNEKSVYDGSWTEWAQLET